MGGMDIKPNFSPASSPYLYRKRFWRKIVIVLAFSGVGSSLCALQAGAKQTGNSPAAAQSSGAQPVSPLKTAGDKASKDSAEVLEVLPSRHLAVQVTLNGQGPFRMILDTGSPLTFVTNAVALKSGLLKPEQAKQPALFGMRGQITAKTLAVGSTQLRDFPILILDHPVIETLQQIEGPIDGILGFSFFSRYRMVIDYAAKSVRFAPNGYQPEDMLGGLMARLMSNQASRRVLAPLALWGMEVAPLQTTVAVIKPRMGTAGKSGQSETSKPSSQEGKPGTITARQPGIVIARVFANSAAAAGGLKSGDRLLSIESRWTDTLEDCLEAVTQTQPGEMATLYILRQGKPLVLTVMPRIGL